MSARSYQRYPVEFKQSSAKLASESAQPVSQTARELGITVNTLHNWVNKYSKPKEPTMQQTQRHDSEMQRLRKQLSRVTEERDLLKKAAAYFAAESQ
jgi:transposase